MSDQVGVTFMDTFEQCRVREMQLHKDVTAERAQIAIWVEHTAKLDTENYRLQAKVERLEKYIDSLEEREAMANLGDPVDGY